jgi:hypothetical protein
VARGFGSSAGSASSTSAAAAAAASGRLSAPDKGPVLPPAAASPSGQSLWHPVGSCLPLCCAQRMYRPSPTIMTPAQHRNPPITTIEDTKEPVRCTIAPTTNGPKKPPIAAPTALKMATPTPACRASSVSADAQHAHRQTETDRQAGCHTGRAAGLQNLLAAYGLVA